MTAIINHPISFETFLKEGGNLYRVRDGYVLNFEVNGALAECNISKDSIAEYDPRLGLIIDDMASQHVGSWSIRRIYVQSLLWSRAHWENPMPMKVRHFGVIHLNRVHNILKFDPQDDHVTLMASIYYRVSRVGDLTYVEDVTRKQIEVEKTELDKYYPGWSLRYELMENVAGNRDDILAAVFPRHDRTISVEATPSLSTVTFD